MRDKHLVEDAFMAIFSENVVDTISGFKDEVVVFSVMRNERLRVEAWITHYRNIGISQFFIIDNGSDDGTVEFLLSQPDVVTVRTNASYQDSNFGIEWLNRFREIIGSDKWVLYADADELMVYEGWPKTPVNEIIYKAEALQCNAIIGFLLDMYPDGPIDSCPRESGKNLFLTAPCFDSDYAFFPKNPWEPAPNCTVSVVGGPRVRLLSNMERETSVTYFDVLIRKQIARFTHWTPAAVGPTILRYLHKWMPPAELMKTPLSKGGKNFKYGNGHGGTGAKCYKQNVVMCHFKFLRDFYDRLMAEVIRKEHYLHAAYYIMYGIMYSDAVKKYGCLDFRYPGTQRFISSEQLVNLGLIREMHGRTRVES